MELPVCIVMAVFRPKPAYLDAQVASLAAQTHRNIHVVFVIADMESASLVQDLANKHDLPFSLVESARELDAVRAFEAGLVEALNHTDAEQAEGHNPLIALCDQDDIWHPDRIARGVAALASSGADLVHSDARLVDADGTELHPSMFTSEKRRKRPGLRGLLYRNNITGMTTLMRRSVVELALPFPPQSGVHFYHDLWLGMVAEARGGVHLIDAPLVDYRQHADNVIGALAPASASPGILKRLRSLDQSWLRREAAAYALARYLANSLQNRLLDVVPDWGDKRPPKALRPYMRRLRGTGSFLWDSFGLMLRGQFRQARIAAGFAIVSLGRSVWTVRLALSEGLNKATERFDTRLFSMAPGMRPIPSRFSNENETDQTAQEVKDLVDLRKQPRWVPDFTAQTPSVTILVPTLNPTEIFAGIATALDIGLGLAHLGHSVRFVATDLPVSSTSVSRRFVLGRRKLSPAAAARVSVECGVMEKILPAHRDDLFIATAWWSAHVADRLIRNHDYAQDRFFYLLQDFEPNFYPWGPEYSDAMASYDLNFQPIFNTTLLRDYFASQGFEFANENSLAFRPSIDVSHYSQGERNTEGRRRLAVYGRPEVPRNMFPTAIEALDIFLNEKNLEVDDIELVSIGLRHPPVQFSNGVTLESLGKLSWEDYPDYLLTLDLGLCLMYSPHPSHPPLEMAASGVRVVSNRFGPKDLATLSPALLASNPSPESLAETLSQAWDMPPVLQTEREIDLSPLGLSLESLIQHLSQDLGACSETGKP